VEEGNRKEEKGTRCVREEKWAGKSRSQGQNEEERKKKKEEGDAAISRAEVLKRGKKRKKGDKMERPEKKRTEFLGRGVCQGKKSAPETWSIT